MSGLRSAWANRRVIRAALALLVTAGVMIGLVEHRSASQEQMLDTVSDHISSSWAVSELFFETLRLSIVMQDYETGQATREDVQRHYSIFQWRIGALRQNEQIAKSSLAQMLVGLDRRLDRWHWAIFDALQFTPVLSRSVRADMTRLMQELRGEFRSIYLADQDRLRATILSEAAAQDQKTLLIEVLIALSLVALGVYILTELSAASRAREKERRLRLAAAAASEAKTRFLANISHELRTPLNGVLGMAQALEDTRLSPEQADLVGTIGSSGDSLLSLLNQLLDFAKAESGNMTLEVVPFDLAEILTYLAQTHRTAARAKRIDFEMVLDDSARVWVAADVIRLQQVLNNLLSNAVKFTEQGSVTLDVRIAECAGQSWLVCLVRDTGIGMSPEAQARIFQPFAQADVSTTRRFGGTGLGLSIVKEICQLAGGTIDVSSAEGQGTTFTFCLPVARYAPEVPRIAPDVTESWDDGQTGRALSLLLVDDSAVNRKVLRKLLERMGHRVQEACDGVTGLERARNGIFDAVLVDVQMPGLDGVEMTRRLRAGGPGHVHIIGVTANVLPEQVQAYLAAGMDAVVSKPVRREALSDALAALNLRTDAA